MMVQSTNFDAKDENLNTMTAAATYQIHIIEDSEPDFVALRRAVSWALGQMEATADFVHHTSAEDAYQALLGGVKPDLTFIDINLRGETGLSFLARVRNEPRIVPFPKVILTTSMSPSDISTAFKDGAAGYLIKPVAHQELREVVQKSLDYWFRASQRPRPEEDVIEPPSPQNR